MSKKSEFIKYVETLMNNLKEPIEMSEEASSYWEALKVENETTKVELTDHGKVILEFLQKNPSTTKWKAKDIAEGMGVSSRAVSGAMRKLVTENFVEKLGDKPAIYIITDKGINYIFEGENE